MSPTYGHVTKLFLESEFQYKGKKQTKNLNSLWFSWEEQIQKIKLFKYNTEKQLWTKLSSLGQEPTFKAAKSENKKRLFNVRDSSD